MGNNKLSKMIQINNIPWEGIKALSLIILKKMALIWVIIFLFTNSLYWFGRHLDRTVKPIELDHSVVYYFESFFGGVVFALFIGHQLARKIQAVTRTNKKRGLGKLSIYPISSFSLVNMILLLNIVLTWGNLLICHFIWNAHLPIISLLNLLLLSLCYSFFGLGILFYPDSLWIILNVLLFLFWGLSSNEIQTTTVAFPGYIYSICYIILTYLLFLEGAFLIRRNWMLKDWITSLSSNKNIIRNIGSLSFIKNLKFQTKPGNLLLTYWRLSYFYWYILVGIITIILLANNNGLFWGWGGMWVLGGILTRPVIRHRANIDKLVFLLPLSNNKISRIRLVDYYLKIFIGIMSLVICYLAFVISYGFNRINEIVWFIFSVPMGVSLLCFAFVPSLISKLENVLPFYFPNKKIRYGFHITHAFITLAAWLHFCFSYYITKSISWITYLWLIYILLILTVSIVWFILKGYEVTSLKAGDGVSITAIAIWFMANLAMVSYFSQSLNSSIYTLTIILQIILIEIITLSAVCIPLEVRLIRNRD